MSQNYVKRTIFDRIANHLDKEEISLIVGPRQVGKTVLLKQLKEYLIREKSVDSEKIYTFNLDVVKDKELFDDQTIFIDFIKQKSAGGKIYVFIDEAQKAKDPGIFFKGVYDLNLPLKLILTGSSTLEIKSKIFESLTGRKRVFYLLPFSFSEILSFKRKDLHSIIISGEKILEYDKTDLLQIFYEYCVWGGYPKQALADDFTEKKELLNEIFTSYVEKDIIGFLKIQNETSFIKFVRILASRIGNLINISELSKVIETDRITAGKYFDNLTKTFVIYNLMPFFSNALQEVVKANKVYFIDAGLRNSALGSLDKPLESREDKGALLENVILKELLVLQDSKKFGLKFWRSKQKAEVDFIIEKGLDVIPVEVKSNNVKLEQSLLGFISRYNPKKALVINLNFHEKKKIGNTDIFFIYPWELEKFI